MIEKSYSKCWLCMTKDSNCASQDIFWFKERGFCLCARHLEEIAYKAVMGDEQRPCEDCISREDALMCLTGEYGPDKEYPPEEIIAKHVRRIKALPPVQPARRKGKWIQSTEYETMRCSECKIVYRNSMFPRNFCPNCGADMRKE